MIFNLLASGEDQTHTKDISCALLQSNELVVENEKLQIKWVSGSDEVFCYVVTVNCSLKLILTFRPTVALETHTLAPKVTTR